MMIDYDSREISGRSSKFAVIAAIAIKTLVVSLFCLSGATTADTKHDQTNAPNATHLEQVSSGLDKVLSALKTDTSLGRAAPVSLYEVTLLGFDYIDAQCDVFLSELLALDRRRRAHDSSLSRFSSTTKSILSLTGASKLSIDVLARVFDLPAPSQSKAAERFILEFPPDAILRIVKQNQITYRARVASRKSEMTSSVEVLHNIREYLHLCMLDEVAAWINGQSGVVAESP